MELGFTIIELLVAMSIFAMMTLMIAGLVDGVSLSTDLAHRKIDSTANARDALERIGLDLERMLKRSDIHYGFAKKVGNDVLTFYTQTQAYDTTTRPISVVRYRILNNQLTRATKTVADSTWGTPIFIKPDDQVLNADDLSPEAMLDLHHYQVIAEDVLRLEFAYLVRDGVDGIAIRKDAPDRFEDLRGLVIGMVTLDERSRSILTLQEVSSMEQSYADAYDGVDVLAMWKDEGASLALNSRLSRVVPNLRIYQRYHFFQ